MNKEMKIQQATNEPIDEIAIPMNEKQDVKDLISDLRQAVKMSARTGGEYGVWRKVGQRRVVFNIHLPMKL